MTDRCQSTAGVSLKRRSPDLWILAGIIAMGALLRGLYLVEIVDRPDFSAPAVDAEFHDYWARGLATGDWTPPRDDPDPAIGRTPYLRPPGYPYFLAAIYLLAGTGPVAPRVLQMALGLLNCVLAFAIGRRWYGRGTGLTWAGLMSVYWVFIYFEGELHAIVLSIFLLLLTVYLLGRWAEGMTLPYAVGAGVLSGIAALVRPNALLLLLVIPLWMIVLSRRRNATPKGLTAAGALILAALVTISPATIRNYVVARDFVLISANGGVNLFIGNHEQATGRCTSHLPGIGRFGTCFDYPGIVAALEQKQGKPLRYSEVSSYFRDRALTFIKNNPLDFLQLSLNKALWFWGPTEIGHNKEIHFERQFSPVLSRVPGDFPTVLALALAGGAMLFMTSVNRRGGGEDGGTWKRHAEMSVLMILVILALFFSVLPFFAAGRYRVTIIPFLLLFAACGICTVVRLMVARRWLPVVCWVGAGVVGCFALRQPVLSVEPDLARWYFDKGIDHERLGDYMLALEYHERSIEIEPLGPKARLAAAEILRRNGNTTEAAVHLRHALQHVHPYVAQAHHKLARVLVDEGQVDQAIVHFRESLRIRSDDVAVRMELAQVLQESGSIQEALNERELVLTVDPDNVEALFKLGLMFHETGRDQEAGRHLRQAVRLEPARRPLLEAMGIRLDAIPTAEGASSATTLKQRSWEELFRQAEQLAQVGRVREALDLYQQALTLKPDDAIIHFKTGEALAAAGRFDEAIGHYRRAVELNPRFAAAHNDLGMTYARLGDAPSAARHYQEAVRIDQDMYVAHYNLGMVLGGGLGRYEEAIEALGKALPLVQSSGRTDLVERIAERIERFRRYQREDGNEPGESEDR